jgi:hypothetical protein
VEVTEQMTLDEPRAKPGPEPWDGPVPRTIEDYREKRPVRSPSAKRGREARAA